MPEPITPLALDDPAALARAARIFRVAKARRVARELAARLAAQRALPSRDGAA